MFVTKIIPIPRDVLDRAPFEPSWKASLISLPSSSVEFSYLTPDKRVLHITPIVKRLAEHERLICERWITRNKGRALANVQNNAPLYHGTFDVSVPHVEEGGFIEYSFGKFRFWYEALAPGELLTKQGKPVFGVYVSVAGWLAQFHQQGRQGIPLRRYFEKRLNAIHRFLRDDRVSEIVGSQMIENVSSKIEEHLENLNKEVEVDEYQHVIHGDLHSDNILINGQQIYVIDFEQGLHGGDWFYDLTKLLVLAAKSEPDPKQPYFYRPPISPHQKLTIIKHYVEERMSLGWLPPHFIRQYIDSGDYHYLSRRQDLYRLDTLASTLIYKLVIGWLFHVDPKCRSRRGAMFIAELLQLHYSWKVA